MASAAAAQEFVVNSRHALEHLFAALAEYHKALSHAQQTVEQIERAKQALGDLFMYRDQWSPNANHLYGQYVHRLRILEAKQREAGVDQQERLSNALANIGATEESMSALAGAVLQVAKQALALRHGCKPDIVNARRIGSQSVVEVIWEGRNHAMHWDEGAPRNKVKDMLTALTSDVRTTVVPGRNNCLSILGALGWKSANDVVADLEQLIQ
jgi:hypothetical protein